MIENSADGITLLESDGTIIDISPSGERILGYPKEEFIGKIKFDVIHPGDVESLGQTFAEINSKPGGSLTNTYRIKHSNGSWLWIETVWNNLLENTSVRAIVLNFRDITARKLAEDSLLESREMLRLAMSGSRTGAWVRDITNDKVEWSEELEALFGLPRGDFAEPLGGFYDKVHPEDRELVRHSALSAIAEHRDYTVEFRFYHADKTLRWMEGRGKAVYAPDGTAVKVYGIGTDITERKRAEEALRQSEARLRLAIEISRTATFEINLVTDAVQTDEIGREIYGFPPNEPLTFTKIQSRFHPEDRDEVVRNVSLALAPEGSDEFEVEQRIIRTNGETRWIRVRGRAFFEGTGDLRRAVTCLGTYIDITERKRAEEDLRQKDEQLRQAHKLESVGRLAGGIAHDFNNMLTVINGYSNLVLDKLETDHALRDTIVEIKKAGERSAALTEQLLAFSRQQILQPKILDLNQTIQQTGKMLERLIGEDVELQLILNSKISRIVADPGQLTQVIINLAINARDALSAGGKITIETDNVHADDEFIENHPPMKAGSYVMLAVSDNGSGMNEETRQQVFEPFFTTKAPGEGTGLGLATVYGIVKQSGGYIWVESEPDCGATFRIYLSASKEAEQEQSISRDSDLPKGTETILLVEDEQIVAKLTAQMLESCGYRVLTAGNGKEALEICEQNCPQIDMLMTDVVMPGMGGRQLAEKLAELLPGIKILFTSGYTNDHMVRHGITETGLNFIQKPFTFENLSKKVRNVIDAA